MAQAPDARAHHRRHADRPRRGALRHRREPLQPLHRRPPGRGRARRPRRHGAPTSASRSCASRRVGAPRVVARARAVEEVRRGHRARRGHPRVDAALRLRRRARPPRGSRARSRARAVPVAFGVLDDRHDRAGRRARRDEGGQQGLGRGDERHRDGDARARSRRGSRRLGVYEIHGMGARHSGREAALQMLFQMEASGAAADEVIDLYWRSFAADADPEGRPYADDAVRGVGERARGQLDAHITARFDALAHRAHGARRPQRPAPRRVGARAPARRAAGGHPRRGGGAGEGLRDRRVERLRQRRAQPDRRHALGRKDDGSETSPRIVRAARWTSAFSRRSLRTLDEASAELLACSAWSDERPMRGLAGCSTGASPADSARWPRRAS